MPFTPSSPSQTVTYVPDMAATSQSWFSDGITEVYDRLIDIDGNYIIDIDSNYISLGGGFVVDMAATASSMTTSLASSSVSWTPEG